MLCVAASNASVVSFPQETRLQSSRKQKRSKQNQPQCHFVRHGSHVIELGPSQCDLHFVSSSYVVCETNKKQRKKQTNKNLHELQRTLLEMYVYTLCYTIDVLQRFSENSKEHMHKLQIQAMLKEVIHRAEVILYGANVHFDTKFRGYY